MTVFGALVLAVLVVVYWRVVLAMVAVGVVALLILGVGSVMGGVSDARGSGSAETPTVSHPRTSPRP